MLIVVFIEKPPGFGNSDQIISFANDCDDRHYWVPLTSDEQLAFGDSPKAQIPTSSKAEKGTAIPQSPYLGSESQGPKQLL